MTTAELLSQLEGQLDRSLLGEIKELAVLAYRDHLTGLPNRRALERDIEALKWERREYALLMIDLDHFKRVNDEYGHDAGDETLRHAAKRLGARLRASDRLYRFGGDEFAILLRASDVCDACFASSANYGLRGCRLST